MIRSAVSGTVLAFALASAAHAQTAPTPAAPAAQPAPTVAAADAFVAEAEKTLAEQSVGAQQLAGLFSAASVSSHGAPRSGRAPTLVHGAEPKSGPSQIEYVHRVPAVR